MKFCRCGKSTTTGQCKSCSNRNRAGKYTHAINNRKGKKYNTCGLMKAEKNPMWKGDAVGYGALHEWVRSALPNPLLMKVLNFMTPKDVLEFNLYQTVTRSIVTSWGSAVENLLFRCGAEKFIERKKGTRAGRRPDLEKEIKGKKFYLQVKSGPNTMNVDMVNSLNEVIKEYKRREPDASFLLGMTYGIKDRISSQIKDNLISFNESVLIGRELWDFVSEENNFHHTLFKILDQSSRKSTSKPFSEHLKDQLAVLIDEWEKTFEGKTLDETYENYI